MPRSPVPADLRSRLETARLDTLALLRAIDLLPMAAQELPHLHELFELDADCAEALWALDQPPGKLDLRAMVRDTLGSLERLAAARARYLARHPPPVRARLATEAKAIRDNLDPREAYNEVPGRAPGFR